MLETFFWKSFVENVENRFRQIRKAATVCALEKKGVLKNSSSDSCHVTFTTKTFEKYLWGSLFTVKFKAKSLQLY